MAIKTTGIMNHALIYGSYHIQNKISSRKRNFFRYPPFYDIVYCPHFTTMGDRKTLKSFNLSWLMVRDKYTVVLQPLGALCLS